MLWLDIFLALLAAVLGVAFYWVSKRLRLRIRVINKARERLETEERRVFDFLHTIGEALSGDMRAEDLHRIIVEGAVQIMEANGGAIYLAERKGQGVRRAFGTAEHSAIFNLPADSSKSKDLLSTFLRWHTVPSGEGIVGEVWRTGEAVLVDPDDPRLPRDSYASAIAAPLVFSGQKLGVLFVTRRSGGEPFLAGSFGIFRAVAEQSAFALHSSAVFHEAAEKKRLDEDLAVAHEIQRILLPNSAPDVSGYQIAGINIPARQVSGDYYDYLEVDPTHCGVAIADVSGKGVPASLIMAMCRSVLRTQAAGQLSPAVALREVNAQLYPDIKEDMFISMAYAVLDSQSAAVTLCRAGHDAPLLFRAKDKSISKINPPGMALGIDSGVVFNRVTGDFTLTLEPEDVLILYTDGVTEALDANGEEFGLKNLIDAVQASASEGAASIITRLTDDLRAFIGPQPQHDDITLIAIRKR